MTNQGARQQSVRDVTGTALDYNGDWHALFDLAGIPAGDFNGRLLAWINGRLGVTYPDLPGAMQAFAESQGAYNWSSMGTFDAAGNREYDFTGGSLPAGATLERASTGTRFNASGVLVSEAIDAARFDYAYDGSVWSLAGLLVEPQRTNHCANSAALQTHFNGAGGGTWTPNDEPAPDGTTTADLLTATGGNSNHGANSASLTGLSGGDPVCVSAFGKKDTRNFFGLLFSNNFASTRVRLDFSTGLVESPGSWGGTAFGDHGVEDVGGGYYRPWGSIASITSYTGDTLYMGFFDSGATAELSWWAWGYQVEKGTFPTSYIPTAGSTATRSADVLTLDLDDGDWDLEVETPAGTYSGSITVSGGAGYEFDWADLTGATGQRHVLSVTATAA
jgi:hypothetical protein